MPNRPAIPAEIAREILLESGHRCAACGTPCPLERAHIIPWHRSKEHKAEDLICLCANCHERADKEKWGEKTLREYKEKPWVIRQYKDIDSKSEVTTRLELTIEIELGDFGEKNQRWLQYAIAAFLEIAPSAVRVTGVEKGSVKVVIELPIPSAKRLLSAYKRDDSELAKHLAPLVLLDVRETIERESTQLTDRSTTHTQGGSTWPGSPIEFEGHGLVSSPKWISVMPFVGGTLVVPPGTNAVLTHPSGRRQVFAKGRHRLHRRFARGFHPVQYVDMRQHRTHIPLLRALCRDGWRGGIALEACWRVRDAALIVDNVDPIGDLVAAASASARAVVETTSHDTFVATEATILANDVMTKLREAPAIRGIEILQILVTDRHGDERRIKIMQDTTIKQTRMTAEAGLVAQQMSLERERQDLVLLQAEIERKRIEEERRVRIREAEIEAEVTRRLMPTKWQQVQLEMAVDTYRQRHEQVLEVIDTYRQVLSEAAKLGNLEASGVSSRRRPELDVSGLENSLKLLSKLENVIQSPTVITDPEQMLQVNEQMTLQARIATEIAEISRLEGVRGVNLKMGGEKGEYRVGVELENRNFDIICRSEHPGAASEVCWTDRDSGRHRVPFAWSEGMSLKYILQVIQAATGV